MSGVQTSVLAAALTIIATGSAAAQSTPAQATRDRQFMFSISTPPSERPHATVHVESGFGDGAFDTTDSDRPEQRIGIQAALSSRLAFVGRVGIASDRRDLRSSEHGELLYSVLRSPATQGSLAIGLGMRHESGGVNVLLGRLAAGRTFSAWRMDGNAIFEKPYATGRDAVDLITTFGVSRRIVSWLHGGGELIGEDIEGFWEEEEAEGGARLLIGPSLRIVPHSHAWQVSLAGGPIVRATRSGRTSDATRGLPGPGSDTTYAVRASLSYGF